MGTPERPTLAKLFVGLIVNPQLDMERIERELEKKFGQIDTTSSVFQFDFTDYYTEEMGEKLRRKFVSFENLLDPESIVDAKLKTNQLEKDIADQCKNIQVARPVNIDPGYLGLSKLVLVTTKNYSHRIYLGSGIYGEVTLRYKDRGFKPLPWTYPDYQTQNYLSYFNSLREEYTKQLDALRDS